jgi:DNA-binding transcriptional LysR family regulator
MRDGIDAVGALRGATHGIVTLAIVGTLASTGLTERLRRFREAHPAIDLRIRTALSAEVSELVRRGDATLGLRYGNDPHPELPTDLNQWTSRTARPAHRLGRGVARVHNVAEDKLVEQDDKLIIRRFLHVAHLFAFVRRATPLALPPRRPRAARCSGELLHPRPSGTPCHLYADRVESHKSSFRRARKLVSKSSRKPRAVARETLFRLRSLRWRGLLCATRVRCTFADVAAGFVRLPGIGR